MHGTERSGARLRDLYVAQTVQTPQDTVERFLNRLGRRLGRQAFIYTAATTHLTFVESSGLKPAFNANGYCAEKIEGFKTRLWGHLQSQFPAAPKFVRLDPEAPLRWVASRKLAFNVVPSQYLTDVRGAVLQFAETELGELPPMQDFEQHITIGEMRRRPTDGEREDPNCLLPRGTFVPFTVAMNGLDVYLGAIHRVRRQVPNL